MTIQACGDSYSTKIRFSDPASSFGKIETKNALCSAWESWAENANPEEVSDRRLAVLRMRDCLVSGAYDLDLSDLKISSRPEVFPQSMTNLKVSFNFPLSKINEKEQEGINEALLQKQINALDSID